MPVTQQIQSQSVFDLWTQQRENLLEPTPVSFRIRTSNMDAIKNLQIEYGVSQSQILNDLIGIAISKLPTQQL